jgi:hypothetical protein
MKVGDLVRTPSGDVGLVIKQYPCDPFLYEVLFSYGRYQLNRISLEALHESR